MSNHEFLYFVILTATILFSAAFFIIGRVTMRSRVKADLSRQGFKILQLEQKIVGLGWLSYRSPYIFTVRYFDRQGIEHQADCEPNLLWGNRWSNDIVIQDSQRNAIANLQHKLKQLHIEQQHLEKEHQFEIETLIRRKEFLQAEINREINL